MSKIKKTVINIFLIAVCAFLVLVGAFMLVVVFMAEKPMDLTLAIAFSILFVILFSLMTHLIEGLIKEIVELIRLEEQESLEEDKEEE